MTADKDEISKIMMKFTGIYELEELGFFPVEKEILLVAI